jgi:catechol 2,3-dioxygenase-like lactoylglutathione lyase family enzyme
VSDSGRNGGPTWNADEIDRRTQCIIDGFGFTNIATDVRISGNVPHDERHTQCSIGPGHGGADSGGSPDDYCRTREIVCVHWPSLTMWSWVARSAGTRRMAPRLVACQSSASYQDERLLAPVSRTRTGRIGATMKIHHTAICTRDIERSKRFWEEGLGFVEQMDETFDGDWPTLFNARESRLRSVFLGDPSWNDAGLIELVEFAGGIEDARGSKQEPAVGFFLVSVYLAIDPALARLHALGLGGQPTRISLPAGVQMAVVHDPNGVAVELIDLGAD